MLKQKFTANYQLYFIQQNENGFAPQIIFYDSEGMWELSFFSKVFTLSLQANSTNILKQGHDRGS